MLQYLKPKSIQEAISLLTEYEGDAKVIAGGTDLLVQLKKGVPPPQYLIDIKGISGQDYITYDENDGLIIGSMVTVRSVELSSVVKTKFYCLGQAARQLGTIQVRNQATIGGNLCNAAPSAETAPSLMVLEAKLKIVSANGERLLPIEDFFLNPGETVLRPGELLTQIRVPALHPRSGNTYVAQTVRKALDLSIVGVAVALTMDKDILTEARIALGSVAPTPIRARKAEALIRGHKLNDTHLREACQVAAQEAKPIDDIRSSADYRREMVATLVEEALRQAVQQIARNNI